MPSSKLLYNRLVKEVQLIIIINIIGTNYVEFNHNKGESIS